MAEFPSLPLFTDAYLADTRHLTAAQHGAYLLLLMMAWRTPDCSLPNDDAVLSRWASMDKRTWMKNKDTIMAFWRLDNDQKFRQSRLLDERKYVEHKRNINSENGKASALKRKERGSTTAQRNFNETSTPTPTPTYNKKKNNKKEKEMEQKNGSKKYLTKAERADAALDRAVRIAQAADSREGRTAQITDKTKF